MPSTPEFLNVLHFSDVHLNMSLERSVYGLDSSTALFQSALIYANTSVDPEPHLVLYTGDYGPHVFGIPHYSPSKLLETVTRILRMLRETFPSNRTRIISSIIGNSDCLPDYHMPVTNPKQNETNPTLDTIAPAWEPTMTEHEYVNFRLTGYQEHVISPNFSILTLNTIPYSTYQGQPLAWDPFQQFHWLEETLRAIEIRSSTVWITGHIPPIIDTFYGKTMWHSMYIERYVAIVQRFAQIITGQHFAHIHAIQYRASLDPQQQIPPLLTTGSISPIFGNNPTFTYWNIQQHQLTGQKVYGHDESDANADWRPLFDVLSAYQLENFNASQVFKLSSRMKSNASLLELYYRHVYGNSILKSDCLDSNCRAKTWCGTRWFISEQDYNQCITDQEIFYRPSDESLSKLTPANVPVLILACVSTCLLWVCIYQSVTLFVKRNITYRSISQNKNRLGRI